MQEQSMNRIQFSENLPGGFSNKEAEGKLPDNLPSPLKLNLGCGKDVRNSYLNIDLYSDNPNVIKMDIRKLEFQDNSVDEILASDILEHFSHREIDVILQEWARVLKPGGSLVVRCPSLRLQMKAYMDGKWDADIASYMIFGGQTNPGDYHCVAFDEFSIKKHLSQAGLEMTAFEEHDFPQDHGFINLNMTVRAKKEENIIENIPNIDYPSEDKPITSDISDFDFEEHNTKEEFDFDEDLFNEVAIYDNQEEVQQPKDNNMATDNKKKLNIVWEGSQFVYHSLALINREHCYNLIKSDNTNVTIVPYEKDLIDPNSSEKFKELLKNDIRFKEDVSDEVSSLPYIWIRHQWPPKDEVPKGSKWVIMQPWEYTSLRKDFVDTFQKADEIWTPSDFSRRSFVNSGIEFNKVQVIPNGIDPELFTPNGKKFNLETQKSFKLLFVGGTIYRKGIDVLLNVYTKMFKKTDDICLIIKDMGTNSFYKGQTAKDKIKEIQDKPNSPEIIYIENDLNEHEMTSLYRACDVFVSPYRGEGFSLPTLEAMACGLPVIVTQGGPTDEFVDESYGFFIKSEQKLLGKSVNDMEFVNDTYLLEPDPEDLTKIIGFIYQNPGDLKSMGALASNAARSQYTWNKATLKLLTRLDFLYNLDLAKEAQNVLIDKKDAVQLFTTAEHLYISGDNKESAKLFESTLEDNLPFEYKIHSYLRLAIVAINDNEIERAEVFIDLAEKADSEHPDVLYLKTILNAAKKENTPALEVITKLMNNWIKSKFKSSFGIHLDDLLVVTADLLRDEQDLESANQVYTEALKYNPDNFYACYGAGMCFLTAGIDDEALNMFEWSLRINPDFDKAKLAISKIKGKSNN